MFEWLNDALENIGLIFNTLYSRLSVLPSQIDSITFGADSSIYILFGQLHYVLGTPLFIAMSLLVTVMTGLVLYRIAKYIFDFVNKLIGNSKSKIMLP